MRVFPINTCGWHKTSNNEHPRAIYASKFSPPPLLHHQDYFIMFDDVHLQLGKQISGTVILSDPAPGEDE
jgi:hypothetical protein